MAAITPRGLHREEEPLQSSLWWAVPTSTASITIVPSLTTTITTHNGHNRKGRACTSFLILTLLSCPCWLLPNMFL